MNSDNASYGGSAWSAQTVNDSMCACGVGECSNSSAIRDWRPLIWPVSLIRTHMAIKVKGTRRENFVNC